MPRALVLGGTGAIGRAVAGRLLPAGWAVDLAARDPAGMPPGLAAAGASFLAVDHEDQGQLRSALGSGAELLVDCACYTAGDADRMRELAAASDSTVMISSKAVYTDSLGRNSNSAESPHFGRPIAETQATVPPGRVDPQSAEGYAADKVAAELVLLESGLPITVLRPSKVHGAGARRPREWVFVRRVLDGRSAVLLANRGAGIDHPSAAANVAALIELVATKPGRRILNCADPDAPSALQIARVIASRLGHQWEEVLLPPDAEAWLGRTPWDRRHPIVLDTTAAVELGYRPVGDYAATVGEEVDWLVAAASGSGETTLLPARDDRYFRPMFDYPAEDRFLGERSA